MGLQSFDRGGLFGQKLSIDYGPAFIEILYRNLISAGFMIDWTHIDFVKLNPTANVG